MRATLIKLSNHDLQSLEIIHKSTRDWERWNRSSRESMPTIHPKPWQGTKNEFFTISQQAMRKT